MCQPGNPSPHGEGQCMMCPGAAFFHQGEVERTALVVLAVQFARVGHDVVQIAAREYAVAVFPVVSLHIEIDRAVRLVGEAVGQNPFHELDLLDDVSRSMGFDRGREHVQRIHRAVVALRVVVRHLHRFELFEPRLSGDLVLALVGVVLQMAHVGDVAHVTHLVAQRAEVAEQQIERYGRTGMAQMGVAVDRGTADVHAYMGRIDGLEHLLAAGERIIKDRFGFHKQRIFCKNSNFSPHAPKSPMQRAARETAAEQTENKKRIKPSNFLRKTLEGGNLLHL